MSAQQPKEESSYGDPLEHLLAQCIECLEQEGQGALDTFLAAHSDQAESLRKRLAALSKVGLLREQALPGTTQIGPFRVLRQLGSGGMGQVLLVEDERDGSQAALKLGPSASIAGLPGEEGRELRARERFLREVEALREVDHPGIVRILEVGDHGGQAWFTMEYVAGVPLDRALLRVKDLRLPGSALRGEDLAQAVPGSASDAFGSTWAEVVANLGSQVAQALSAAHALGIVHRDVKPSNILLRADGRAQLFDFGLAHLENMPTLTLSGEFAGTPYYVAPEQIQGQRGGVDGRADVFSLGITLYECACLERPFAGDTPMEVLTAISTHDAPSLNRIAPHLPADLVRICERALEKDRRHRYSSMTAMAADLGCLLAGNPLKTKPFSRVHRGIRFARRRPWQALAFALAATLVAGIPIGLAVANVQIRSQRDQALQESTWKSAVVEHLVEHFEGTGNEAGTDEAAQELLERGVQRLRSDFEDQPRVQAALLHASGRAFLQLGRPNEARPLLDRALGLLMQGGVGARQEMVHVLVDLGSISMAAGEGARARDLMLRALSICEEEGEPSEFERRARTTLAAAEASLDNSDRARELLAELDPVQDTEVARFAGVWEILGRRALDGGSFEVAREAWGQALDLRSRDWSPDPLGLAQLHEWIAELGRSDRSLHLERAARLRESQEVRAVEPVEPAFVEGPAWAAEYADASGRGVAAIQDGRLEEARAQFLEALDLRPNAAIPAYNLACVAVNAGNLEEAAQWLVRAREEGYACALERVRTLTRDPDLAALRASSEGQGVMRALGEQWEIAQEYATNDVFQLAGNENTSQALLVVVHDGGAQAKDRADDLWGAVAEQVQAALLIPAAPYLAGPTGEDGGDWALDERDYWQDPQTYGAPVIKRLQSAIDAEPIDRRRIWIAGEGMGAMLALELAHTYPGLFRGVLLVNPVLSPTTGKSAGRLCRALGLRLAVHLDSGVVPEESTSGDVATHADRLRSWLGIAAGWGDHCRIEVRPSGDSDALAELVEWLEQT